MEKGKGFTLIELLVVIAIIALLMAIVMPGLNMAKKKAASAACLSNVRQMSLAWYMYAEENNGKIMSAYMQDPVAEINRKLMGWIGWPRDASGHLLPNEAFRGTSPVVTDEDEIRGAEKGRLYPYVESPEVYHCPADKLRKGPDGTRLYVSYALAGCLYGQADSFDQQIRKISEITAPGTRYTFVENGESNRGNWIMGGSFAIAAPEYGADGYGLWSPVAISHGSSNTFGFADGHAEIKKWHDGAIFDHYKITEMGALYYGFRMEPDSGDVAWLGKGWAYRYKE